MAAPSNQMATKVPVNNINGYYFLQFWARKLV